MKGLPLLLLLLVAFSLTAQLPAETGQVFGTVTAGDARLPLQGVAMCVINLMDQTVMDHDTTGPLGNYTLAYGTAEFIEVRALPFEQKDNYLSGRQTFAPRADLDRHFVCNIALSEVHHCTMLPVYWFKSGSTTLVDSTRHAESLNDQMDFFLRILEDNPTLAVTLHGHSDHLEAPGWSELRAQRIKDELVHQGVDPRRVLVKGWGFDCPKHRAFYIGHLPPAEQVRANLENRRVEVWVANHSFDPGQP